MASRRKPSYTMRIPAMPAAAGRQTQGLPLYRVQHHHAHASALAFEGGLDKTWLTVHLGWCGLAEDGTLWGGEALHGKPGAWQRVASFKPFRLPGGERAGREPWRSAAALCWESGLEWQFGFARRGAAQKRMGARAECTGHDRGRAFVRRRVQPARSDRYGELRRAGADAAGSGRNHWSADAGEAAELPLDEDDNGLLVADWTPLLHALRRDEMPVAQRAMQFHLSLAQTASPGKPGGSMQRTPFDAVGLTGGVFQNKLLAELALATTGRCRIRGVPAAAGAMQ